MEGDQGNRSRRPEDLTASAEERLKNRCPNCLEPVDPNARQCPHCGSALDPERRRAQQTAREQQPVYAVPPVRGGAEPERGRDTERGAGRGRHRKRGSMDGRQLAIVIGAAVAGLAAAGLCLFFVIRSMAPDDAQKPEEPPVSDQDQLPPEDGDKPEEPPIVDDEPDVPDEPDLPDDNGEGGKPPVTDGGEEQPPEEKGPTDPLTGLAVEADNSYIRPFAVMLNNIRKATPQEGIGSADIIFEIPVEGGITRFMAIYQDFKGLEELGSVRSSRPYYVDIALGYDAIYIHAGGSDDAYKRLKNSGIDYIDGVNGSGETFHRDAWRKANMGTEHSLMLDTPKLPAYLEKHNISTEHKEGFVNSMTFAEDQQRTGDPATSVKVKFNSSKYTSFVYNEATRMYSASQYGGKMTDSVDGTQVQVRNIAVIKTAISRISGDDKGRLTAKTTGTGEGFFIADGVCQAVTWTRAANSDQFVFTGADGEEIVYSPGVTYIALVPTSGGSVEIS